MVLQIQLLLPLVSTTKTMNDVFQKAHGHKHISKVGKHTYITW